jgi:FKBP-type peptidyl-prolyl cis-trans isomerase SlyD
MQVAQDTVVTLKYELRNSEGEVLEQADEPLEYLHGGHQGMFPRIEEALTGKSAGESLEVYLQPVDAFGEYDDTLVQIEPRDKFPTDLEVGMRFEGGAEDGDGTVVYTVTDIADGKVVVDGNHPLAGMALRFICTIESIRAATAEELEHGHVHGAHGHDHGHDHGH